MRRLNPVYKLLGILVYTFILALVHLPLINLFTFVLCFALLLASAISPRTLLLMGWPILVIAIGLYFTGIHFHAGGQSPVRADTLNLLDSSVYNGLILSTRVLAYAGLGLLFALTTDKIRLIHAFRQQLHVPAVLAFGLLAAWNILPDLVREYRRCRMTLKLRGLPAGPLSLRVLKPMLVKAVLYSQALAQAMESKGFNGNAPRTESVQITIHWYDYCFPFLASGGLLLLVHFLG